LYLQEKSGSLLFGKNYTDGNADISIDYIKVDYSGAFAPITPTPTYSVSIADAITNGTVTADKASYIINEEVTLTAAPAEGYELTEISVYKTGDEETVVTLTGEGNERTFVMPAYDVTVTATFDILDGIRLTNASPVIISFNNDELQARFDGTASVKLYSLTGVLINATTANGLYTCRVKPGVYILSVSGRSYKVVI
jgi:hypothetical protein